MAIASAPISQILEMVGVADISLKVEDETYIQNSIRDLKLAKAFDLMDQAALSFKHAMKAFKTVDCLVKLRSSQGSADYTLMLAPFYYKLGDSLATFIELNTDEFGNVKPLPSECESSDEDDGD